MSEVPEVADRRSVLVATGLAAVGSVSLRGDASGLHEACMAALTATVRAYETSDLITTTSALVSLERTTQTVPREHRLRGRPAPERRTAPVACASPVGFPPTPDATRSRWRP
ncbi:hypothetical protein [Frankia sp. KB5]|uniref:hypothetical protein n=1 Tax=Frankia sp. KB5 TaxID=683318 RepID=UPI001F53CB51|nr:hypothetical protein [Frankia sp. KB5]